MSKEEPKGKLDDVIQLFKQWCEEDNNLSEEEQEEQQEFLDSFLNKSKKEITIEMFLNLLEQDIKGSKVTLSTNIMEYVQTLVQGVEINLDSPLLDEDKTQVNIIEEL